MSPPVTPHLSTASQYSACPSLDHKTSLAGYWPWLCPPFFCPIYFSFHANSGVVLLFRTSTSSSVKWARALPLAYVQCPAQIWEAEPDLRQLPFLLANPSTSLSPLLRGFLSSFWSRSSRENESFRLMIVRGRLDINVILVKPGLWFWMYLSIYTYFIPRVICSLVCTVWSLVLHFEDIWRYYWKPGYYIVRTIILKIYFYSFCVLTRTELGLRIPKKHSATCLGICGGHFGLGEARVVGILQRKEKVISNQNT